MKYEISEMPHYIETTGGDITVLNNERSIKYLLQKKSYRDIEKNNIVVVYNCSIYVKAESKEWQLTTSNEQYNDVNVFIHELSMHGEFSKAISEMRELKHKTSY